MDLKEDNWLKLRVIAAIFLFAVCQFIFWRMAENSHQDMIARYALPPDSPWLGDTWFAWGTLAVLGGLIVSGVLLLALTVTTSAIGTVLFLGAQYFVWNLAGRMNSSWEDKTPWDEHFMMYLGLNFVLCMAVPMMVGIIAHIVGVFRRVP